MRHKLENEKTRDLCACSEITATRQLYVNYERRFVVGAYWQETVSHYGRQNPENPRDRHTESPVRRFLGRRNRGQYELHRASSVAFLIRASHPQLTKRGIRQG